MHTPLHLHTRLFAKKYCLLIYYKKIHSTNNLLYRIAGLAGLRYKKGQKCNMQHQRRGRSRTRRCRRRCRCRRLRPHAGWRVEKRERDCASASQPSAAAPRESQSCPAELRRAHAAGAWPGSRWTPRPPRLRHRHAGPAGGVPVLPAHRARSTDVETGPCPRHACEKR